MDAARGQPEPNSIWGAYLLGLLIQPATWVHRRVERIHWLNSPTAVRRSVSIDCQLPPKDKAVMFPEGDLVHLVPIGLVERPYLRLTVVNVRNERGDAIPLLDGWRADWLAYSALVEAAKLVRGAADPLEEALVQALWTLLSKGGNAEGVKALVGTQGPMATAFAQLVAELAGRRLLAAIVPASEGGQRVLKLSHDHVLRGAMRTPRQALGWYPTFVDYQVSSVGDAGSYHCELVLPGGLEPAWMDFQLVRPGAQVRKDSHDDSGADSVDTSAKAGGLPSPTPATRPGGRGAG